MADRAIDINLTKSTEPSISEEDRLRAEVFARFEAIKPMQVELLARGVTIDILKVDLPSDLYGEWVRDDPKSVAEMQAQGFVIDTVYAKRRAVHKSGEDIPKVADVIHMITPKENKDRIDQIRRSHFLAQHGDKRQQEEERAFLRQMTDLHGAGITTMNNSTAETISGEQLVNTLKEK